MGDREHRAFAGARALIELAESLGFRARPDAEAAPGDFAAVVASLGHGDEDALRCALAAGCDYVGLVASRRRGAAVLAALRAAGVPDESLARVRTPAGLDIVARTHAEIALSILAGSPRRRSRPTSRSAARWRRWARACCRTSAAGSCRCSRRTSRRCSRAASRRRPSPRRRPAAAAAPEPADALDLGSLGGAVIAGRLRDRRALAGLLALAALIVYLLLRRRA